MPSRRILVGASIIAALGAAAVWTVAERRKPRTASIQTLRGPIGVEVADTPAARAAGLANRPVLGGIDGLFLKWNVPGRHPIWMQGMQFAIDVVWIDSDGRILATLGGVPPCSGDPCSLYEPPGTERSVAVLELPANTAAHRGFAVGATVSIPGLSPLH